MALVEEGEELVGGEFGEIGPQGEELVAGGFLALEEAEEGLAADLVPWHGLDGAGEGLELFEGLLGGGVELEGIGLGEVADALATEIGEVGGGAEGGAEVAADGADVGALAAIDADGGAGPVEVEQLDAVDTDGAWGQFGLAAFSGEVVGALAGDLDGGDGGGDLQDVAGETGEQGGEGLGAGV